jgi:hypothetical protein
MDTYLTWQGTYSACFSFRAAPIWGQGGIRDSLDSDWRAGVGLAASRLR